LHEAEGRTLLAWRDARWAIDCNPEASDAYLLRGRLALEIESPREALEDLDLSLDLHPESGEAHAWRGRAHQLGGDVAAAERDWLAARALLPQHDPLLDAIERWRAELRR
jgi:tetratricopeptide (TPR) repeat protein